MEKERPLYQLIARSAIAAANAGASQNWEWRDRHNIRIEQLVKQFMPSGSGFDGGTHFDHNKSHHERLVFVTSYHHMNTHGFYEGWSHHTVIVTPAFDGFNLRVTGRDRNGIKEYIAETFHYCLSELRSYADVDEPDCAFAQVQALKESRIRAEAEFAPLTTPASRR